MGAIGGWFKRNRDPILVGLFLLAIAATLTIARSHLGWFSHSTDTPNLILVLGASVIVLLALLLWRGWGTGEAVGSDPPEPPAAPRVDDAAYLQRRENSALFATAVVDLIQALGRLRREWRN